MSEPSSSSPDEFAPSASAQSVATIMPPGSACGPGVSPSSPKPSGSRVVETIVFTDIEGSVALEQHLGTERYAEVLTRHGELFYEALGSALGGEVEKHTGDGYMARFRRPSDAVAAALRFQSLLRREAWGIDRNVRVRVGIHQGEVLLLPSDHRHRPSTVGAPVNLASRVLAMAVGGQILLTRSVFDDARQFVKTIAEVPADAQHELRWEAHGAYLIRGLEGAVEIFEVGERGRAPFSRPKDSEWAQRSVSAEEEATLGWRPAKGLEVPKRAGWILQRALGEGGFGEVWLAENRKTHGQRVFKFCFDAVRLRSFKREVLLFRLIQHALGQREDIATLHEVQLDSPPFFLESAYCPGGTLSEWVKAKLRAGGLPVGERLAIVARIARALAAAHSVGIIHKDVKPSNIFIEERPDGAVQPRLADFGIGVLADQSALGELDFTFSNAFTIAQEATHTGTQLYSAPEYLVGRPPSVQGDIFSLGVLLYQMVIGNFERPLGAGWQRDIADPLLAEDIAGCVDVDPERRFASALQVAERLETLEERRAAIRAADEAAQREAEQTQILATHRRRLRMALTGAAIALALIGALGVAVIASQNARRAAVQHANDLKREREVNRDRLYVADMMTAAADVAQGRSEAAREAIVRQRPAPGERDRRGWEWYFADALLNTAGSVQTASPLPLRAMAVSPDERLVATAGDAGEISLWSCDGLEKVHSWRAGDGAVRSLGWSKNGLLAAGLSNGEVALWDAATGEERKRWKAHANPASALDWHPREPVLVTGGGDGVVAWWREDGTSLREMRKAGGVQALDWREDGSELAVVLGRPARFFLIKGGESSDHEFGLSVTESALAWRPGVYEVAIAKDGMPMQAWNPHTCADSLVLSHSLTPGASAYAWSPEGEAIAVGGIDGQVLIVDSRMQLQARAPLHGHRGRVTGMQWLHRGRERLLTVGEDGTLRAWDQLTRSPEIADLALPSKAVATAWHPREPQLAVLLGSDEVQVLAAGTWQPRWSRPLPPPRPGSGPFSTARLAWSSDGQWLAAACPGRALTVWRVGGDGTQAPVVREDLHEAFDVAWMPDNRRLLVRMPTGWTCATLDHAEPRAIPGTKKAVWVGALDGETLGVVAPGESGALRFFTTSPAGEAPRLATPLPAGFGTVRCTALNADGTRLALGGEAGVVAWVNTRTGEWHRPAQAHTGPVAAVGWHPDGTRLVSAGSDGTCRIFHVAQGSQNWMILHKLPPEVIAAGWDPNGRTLLVASRDDRGERKGAKVFDASASLLREKHAPAPLPMPAPAERFAHVCRLIEEHPGEEFAWRAFAQELRQSRSSSEDTEIDTLLAAAELAMAARFSPLPDSSTPKQGALLESWRGAALPLAVQVAQACALGRWEEALTLCAAQPRSLPGASWFALAQAEAFSRLGRHAEAEASNLAAWQALRREHGASDTATRQVNTVPASPDGSGGVKLTPWANVPLSEDWTGGENNNLSSLGADRPPEGFSFVPRDFIQLAGRTFRLNPHGRMLARSIGWLPTSRPANRLSFLVGACYVDSSESLQDMCIGSLFLLREGGSGAARVPLLYGRNVWDWWLPAAGSVQQPTPEVMAWAGQNPNAQFRNHSLGLYRVDWESVPSAEKAAQRPIVAISFVSHLRQPAPMLLAAEAQETKTETAER